MWCVRCIYEFHYFLLRTWVSLHVINLETRCWFLFFTGIPVLFEWVSWSSPQHTHTYIHTLYNQRKDGSKILPSTLLPADASDSLPIPFLGFGGKERLRWGVGVVAHKTNISFTAFFASLRWIVLLQFWGLLFKWGGLNALLTSTLVLGYWFRGNR